jgi:hypoxanthine-guanine phosphoribosyltransferase
MDELFWISYYNHKRIEEERQKEQKDLNDYLMGQGIILVEDMPF